MDSAAFQDNATVLPPEMARGVGGFKEAVMPNSPGGVPSELLQVLICACMGKGARFVCWLAHVCTC